MRKKEHTNHLRCYRMSIETVFVSAKLEKHEAFSPLEVLELNLAYPLKKNYL